MGGGGGVAGGQGYTLILNKINWEGVKVK